MLIFARANLGRHQKFVVLICLCVISFLLFNFSLSFFKSPLDSSLKLRNNRILVYNRIPKTGSTSIVRIFETLSGPNKFHVYRIAIFNPIQFINSLSHKALVDEVTSIRHHSRLLVHGHFYYINFRQYGTSNDYIYINCLRKPLQRFVSKYYFMRFGDNHRPNTRRSRMTNDTIQWQTFDECVAAFGKDCDPKLLWVQIPFFCGTAAYCSIPGNVEALRTAKRRLIEDYLLVGVLDYFNEFMELLSHLLPDYLSGIQGTRDLKIDGHPLWHLRVTKSKSSIHPKTFQVFYNNTIWRMEEEFYEFARSEFISRYRSYKSSPFNQAQWKQSVFIRAS